MLLVLGSIQKKYYWGVVNEDNYIRGYRTNWILSIMYNIKYETTHHDGLKFYTFTNPATGSQAEISTKVARMYLDDAGIEESDDEMAVQRFIETLLDIV